MWWLDGCNILCLLTWQAAFWFTPATLDLPALLEYTNQHPDSTFAIPLPRIHFLMGHSLRDAAFCSNVFFSETLHTYLKMQPLSPLLCLIFSQQSMPFPDPMLHIYLSLYYPSLSL